MKKHNFSAGPAILPHEVIEGSAQAVKELDNIGLSLIEISHRSAEFKAIMEEACTLSLQLLGLEGKGYQALFLQGGASLQFLMTAYNLLENWLPLRIKTLIISQKATTFPLISITYT
jgi:phosphoserine aminotransferase